MIFKHEWGRGRVKAGEKPLSLGALHDDWPFIGSCRTMSLEWLNGWL